MADSAITAYIRDNLAAGHKEAAIRERLLASGWQTTAVNEAFAQIKQHKVRSSSITKPRRGGRRRAVKWTRKRQLGMVVALVIVIIAALGVHSLITPDDTSKIAANQLQHLTLQTRQANDINTIAGAVGQYTAANGGVLPSATSDAAGSLVLCGSTCDPLTSQVASLSVYAPSDVKIVPYRAGLAAPTTTAIYLVPLGKCAGGVVGAPNPNPRSMILLYRAATTPASTPRCLSL